MFKITILSLIILFASIALFCIRLIIKKDGKFPSGHVEDSLALRKKGIRCVRMQDSEATRRMNLFERMNGLAVGSGCPVGCSGADGCGLSSYVADK